MLSKQLYWIGQKLYVTVIANRSTKQKRIAASRFGGKNRTRSLWLDNWIDSASVAALGFSPASNEG